jgi:hypothetical protein
MLMVSVNPLVVSDPHEGVKAALAKLTPRGTLPVSRVRSLRFLLNRIGSF